MDTNTRRILRSKTIVVVAVVVVVAAGVATAAAEAEEEEDSALGVWDSWATDLNFSGNSYNCLCKNDSNKNYHLGPDRNL